MVLKRLAQAGEPLSFTLGVGRWHGQRVALWDAEGLSEMPVLPVGIGQSQPFSLALTDRVFSWGCWVTFTWEEACYVHSSLGSC